MDNIKFILASKSPRRRELLLNIGISFDVIIDDSEEVIDLSLEPQEIVMNLARQKSQNVSDKLQDKNYIIIAADTVVVKDEQILGKPKDEADAFKMLKHLSGEWHEVYTGIAVYDKNKDVLLTDYECTRVKFKEIDINEIKRYIACGEPMDKAGSYGIQNKGAFFVEKIEGDYFNVVGLPICKLGKILSSQFNINVL